jgi:hypothetical protein
MAQSPVFISYSRRDYYFAESLAFHLLREGVPAWLDVKDLEPGRDWERDLERALDAASMLVLVATPHAIESERVRAEWQRALARGCRTVVVRFRGATLPPELQRSPSVDFRGSFGPALRQLMALMAAGEGERAPSAAAPLPLPPWVVAMTLALAIPTIGYFLGATWSLEPNAEYRTFVLIAAPLLAAALAWFICIAFVRRRMGMTRLAACLGVLALVFALPALAHSFAGLSHLTSADALEKFSAHSRLGLAFLASPVVGLAILCVVRPEDLLRWTPTGKAWATYRVGRVADAAFARAELGAQLAEVKSFALVHDAVDAPMAQRLRELLGVHGASESTAAGEGVTSVLLLTDRTRAAWLDAQSPSMRDAGLTVIGTRIDLPQTLDGLWRRQWIDFRRWDVRRSDRARSLPQVPDAVTRARLPAPVAAVQHVLCSIAALLFVLAGGLDETVGRSEELSTGDVLPMLTFATSVAWMLVAHRMVKRSRTEAQLTRLAMIAAAATAIVAGADLYTLAGTLAPGRIALAALFVVCAIAWLARRRARVAFWLPSEKLARGDAQRTLGKHSDWSTLVWCFVYALAWMGLMGFG